MSLNLFALTCAELAAELRRRYGKGMFHAAGIYREVFQKGGFRLADIPAFLSSPDLARTIETDLFTPDCRIQGQWEDGVMKFASLLADGNAIESVVIPAKNRTTLCVSSQVGCRMGCRFCTTGHMGLIRNLTVEEIVWQVHAARFTLKQSIDNIVFMGMGEPFDNFDNVLKAVQVLTDQRGLDIPLRRITISTAGQVDGIRELAARNMPNLRLAVSLNAADNNLRSALMPINRKYPLEEIKKSLAAFPLGRDSVLFIEYVLLNKVNDSRKHALELAAFLQGLPVRVNLIPFNPSPSTSYACPSAETIRRFHNQLIEKNVFTRLRRPNGERVMAACGQLGASFSGKRGGSRDG